MKRPKSSPSEQSKGAARWMFALVIVASVLIGAWWLASGGAGKGPSSPETEAREAAPVEVLDAPTELGPAETTAQRQELKSAEPDSSLADRSAPPDIRVQLLDEVSGQPIAGQAWFMIRTGKLDYGRAWGLGPQEDNPPPIAIGITDDEGFAIAPLPEYELVNLCTDRNATYARGSWPIRILAGVAAPANVTLSAGGIVEGRVIDDQGEPLEGIQVYSRTFFDERISYEPTDADGRYSIQRCADFPRSFVLREDDEMEPSRTLPTELGFARPGTSTEGVVNLYAAGHADVAMGAAPSVTAPPVVLPRYVTYSGRVVDDQGSGIEGALVVKTYEHGFAGTGRGEREVPPVPTWTQPDFVATDGQCFTDEDGTFVLQTPAPRHGKTEAWIAAFSPGGDLGLQRANDVKPGGSVEGLSFEMRDAETVRLRLVLPKGANSPGLSDKGAKLVWNLSTRRGAGAPRSGTSLTLSFAATPVIESSTDGWRVLIPRAHQPDRQPSGRTLAGTLFMDGFQPQPFELAPGAMEADVPLKPLRQVRLRVDVTGKAAKWMERANVTVTPERPNPALSVEDQVRSSSFETPISTKVYSWKNDEQREVDVVSDRPVYAYVQLFGGGRAALPLPPFGPIPLLEGSGDEGIFVLQAQLDQWPEKGSTGTEAADSPASSSLKERRPTTITARIVSDADGSFLASARVRAKIPSVEYQPFGSQRLWKGEERALSLKVSAEAVTLHFSDAAHYAKDIGPLSLEAGATVDLGEIRLEPLRKIPCRLVNASGAPIDARYAVTRRDPEAGWARVRTDDEGRFDLFVGRTGPTPLRIKREGSNDPPCAAAVELEPDGSGLVVIPEWRPVRVRVQGLAAPYCYGLQRLSVQGEAGPEGEEPIRTRYSFPQLDGTDLVFHCGLPPGQWTFLPANPTFASFPPMPLLVEPVAPGAQDDDASLDVTIRATLTD